MLLVTATMKGGTSPTNSSNDVKQHTLDDKTHLASTEKNEIKNTSVVHVLFSTEPNCEANAYPFAISSPSSFEFYY